MKRRIEQYFQRVELLTGGGGQLVDLDTEDSDEAVSIIEYRNIPEPGDFTTFSFGVSDAHHPEWIETRPELLISVQSDDSAWGFCMGEIIRLKKMPGI